jgi:hypothetical protein
MCVGDLRNKFAKQERDERHREWLAKHFPLTPLPEPIRCEGCQRSYYEVQVYQVPKEWKGPYNYACPACMMLAGYGEFKLE